MDAINENAVAARDFDEAAALERLIAAYGPDKALRERIGERAVELVQRIREDGDSGMMELFLAEYGLSTAEGIALMCLAEALLRVPDGATMDALIDDKIAPSDWNRHLGKSNSSLVNASTWALFVTGKVLDERDYGPVAGVLHGAIKRLGEPVIRQAVTRVMKELGRQFVLGETIEKAIARAADEEAKGYTYSYDMLGEGARTRKDAGRYMAAYEHAIDRLAKAATAKDIRDNPGISIKLSALHPRYETLQQTQVMQELVPRALSLAKRAKRAGIGLNIDAEEAARLELSLDIIEAMLGDTDLAGWDGFGVVIQAYGLRASAVIDRLYALAKRLDRRIMVRLVKGAYWDTEIKHAQVEGHAGFPVFTRKAATDVSYICCARQLLSMRDRIYPQFATHNAHTVAAILEMAEDRDSFEFQRLHGMGEALHDTVLRRQGTRCRIYAPVGAHRDLLAYLVRRLLENGANSSFVNQIVDETVPPEEVAADPFAAMERVTDHVRNPAIRLPGELFAPERENSRGWDIGEPDVVERLAREMGAYSERQWDFSHGEGSVETITNPADGSTVGKVTFADAAAARAAAQAVRSWDDADSGTRADALRNAADLYEDNAAELFSLLAREAGKTLIDCIGEVREAVDFLRYYAAQAEETGEEAAGVFTCISPWNFPLAIFTGQIAAALAVGNGVLAKPAETTPLVASLAVGFLHRAGVPEDVLKLVCGTGAEVGSALVSQPRVDGVCFTGSTATAQRINRAMADHLAPGAPLIAETGGLNAMIVDSTALPEQAVGDIVASAFQSAGQRCSALRVLYLQEDVAPRMLEMLYGAMDELRVGDPRDFATDVGPVIDEVAKAKIDAHIELARDEGRLIKQLDAPVSGTFVGPAVIRVDGIGDLEEEIFGPVLHVATFRASQFDAVIDAINATGYGLTFGLHSRIDDRVALATARVRAGNLYVNRNQIGAVVGSQPFGGEGLSGTGPKAGGPRYLARFARRDVASLEPVEGRAVTAAEIETAFADAARAHVHSRVDPVEDMPGPTGESNRLSSHPRHFVLCLGPGADAALAQRYDARKAGCVAIAIAPGEGTDLDGIVPPDVLADLARLGAVISWQTDARPLRQALASREGAIVPLLTERNFARWLRVERHVCIDTTAAGGNAALMSV